MHIEVEPRDDYAILHLRGEFDTYYVRSLQEEIDALLQAGVAHAVLNLRLVKFINSTALGAIIKASKALSAEGGKLVIARPSSFCKDVMEKVGLDRVVPIFGTDEEAAAALRAERSEPAGDEGDEPVIDDEAAVLFAPTDKRRIEHFLTETQRVGASKNPVHGHQFGKTWRGVGRMASLDENGLRFTWAAGDLQPFAMGQLLAIGTELKIKFRLPLFKPGFCEALATVSEIEERADSVKVGAAFSKIDDATQQAVKQYAADLAFLKDELRKATGK